MFEQHPTGILRVHQARVSSISTRRKLDDKVIKAVARGTGVVISGMEKGQTRIPPLPPPPQDNRVLEENLNTSSSFSSRSTVARSDHRFYADPSVCSGSEGI